MIKYRNSFRIALIFVALTFATVCSVLFSACSDEKKLERIEKRSPSLFQPITKDSVGKTQISYVMHDSIIHLPGQTDTFSVAIPCPQAVVYNHVAHFKSATATLQIDSGKATVICHDDSLNTIISWQNKIIDSNRICIREGLAEKIVAQPPSSFDDFCHWFTILFLIGVVLYLGGKYLPALLKIIKGGI